MNLFASGVARGAYSLDGPYLAFLVFGISVVLLGFSIACRKIGMNQVSPA